MKLFNTLTKKIDELVPLTKIVTVYSCGPTVYDHAHIGNLSSFVFADNLRRSLIASDYEVKHVMNFTDVDDKTIKKSLERFPSGDPNESLKIVTREYEQLFLRDLEMIGFDTEATTFVRATESVEAMHALIRELFDKKIAYIGDDGVYFSIDAYKKTGKKYGQLVEITAESTGSARVKNDEYDKENIHDFALWKIRKDNEPAWDFTLDGHNLLGRPGWHIECSAMSAANLGIPFDIHTGGIDLAFPHHENEIAQSTGASKEDTYARFFAHNEHILVNGKKMSKSLGNFYTLSDILEKGYDAMSFRMLVMQAHYRSQVNFSWEALDAAKNRLGRWQSMAVLRYQPIAKLDAQLVKVIEAGTEQVLKHLQNDLDTPQALAAVEQVFDAVEASGLDEHTALQFGIFIASLDKWLGLNLGALPDISKNIQKILLERAQARKDKMWAVSDELRNTLNEKGIGVKDTASGQIWFYA